MRLRALPKIVSSQTRNYFPYPYDAHLHPCNHPPYPYGDGRRLANDFRSPTETICNRESGFRRPTEATASLQMPFVGLRRLFSPVQVLPVALRSVF